RDFHVTGVQTCALPISAVHPDMMRTADEQLRERKAKGFIEDYCVGRVGDDIALIMTHRHGVDSELVHRIAWEVFQATTQVAKGRSEERRVGKEGSVWGA